MAGALPLCMNSALAMRDWAWGWGAHGLSKHSRSLWAPVAMDGHLCSCQGHGIGGVCACRSPRCARCCCC